MTASVRIIKKVAAALIILCIAAAIGGSTPEKAHAGESGWTIDLAPYLWMTNISGDVAIKGVQASAEASFSDILSNLDFAAQLHVEARKGRWALFLDPTYLKLSSDAKAGPATITIKSEVALVEFGGIYSLLKEPLGEGEKRFAILDLLLGGRYNSLKGTLEFPRGLEFGSKQEWLDPFFGARLRWEFLPKLTLLLRSDIGGFDLGSKIAWNNSLLLKFQPKDWLSLVVGYRSLYMDYENGSGRDLFKYDVTMQGPVAGLVFTF